MNQRRCDYGKTTGNHCKANAIQQYRWKQGRDDNGEVCLCSDHHPYKLMSQVAWESIGMEWEAVGPPFEPVDDEQGEEGKTMKKGDIVTIYKDPITKKKPEGKAKLISRLDDESIWTGEHLIDTWTVRFLGKKTIYIRQLLAEKEVL